MKRLTTFFLSVSTAPVAAPALAGDLDWLAGHWCGVSGTTFSEEVWMAPRGGLLVGMHRDTREGRATGFEFMRIAQQDGAINSYLSLAKAFGAGFVPIGCL